MCDIRHPGLRSQKMERSLSSRLELLIIITISITIIIIIIIMITISTIVITIILVIIVVTTKLLLAEFGNIDIDIFARLRFWGGLQSVCSLRTSSSFNDRKGG